MSLRYCIHGDKTNTFYDSFTSAKDALFDRFKKHTNVEIGFVNEFDPNIPDSSKYFGFENPYYKESGGRK